MNIGRFIESIRNRCSRSPEDNWLRTSQLHVEDAMYLLSRVDARGRNFVDELVRGRNVLEIGCGGHTALVEHLISIPEGARAVLAIDLVEMQDGANEELYERMNIGELVAQQAVIRNALCGNPPDTIVGTSLFGASTLSIDVTRRWIEQCIGVAAPGGVIVVDFLMTGRPARWLARILFCRATVRRDGFEDLLEELKVRGDIRSWLPSEAAGRRVGYKGARRHIRRPRSVTYQITVNGRQDRPRDTDAAASGQN